jgi:alginate O-acetyltransferase complex protein AlgI
LAFNSLSFLFFFPTVLGTYYLLPNAFRLRFLLLASVVFYASAGPYFLGLLAGLGLANFLLGRAIERSGPKLRRAWLAVGISVNAGALVFYKLAPIVGLKDFILPLGFSFAVFQGLGYLIEVFWGNEPAERNLLHFGVYVFFFPKLVAGPVEPPSGLLRQLRVNPNLSYEAFTAGAKLIAAGLFKKLVIADRLAVMVNAVFASPGEYGTLAAALASYGFAYQMYCDFSGYTDIARGTAQMLGYHLVENFNHPFAAASVTEYWKRWHMSVTQWFRVYLYQPFAFTFRRMPAIFISLGLVGVFLISGFWHGATWTYITWGALHGLYLAFPYWRKALGWRPRHKGPPSFARRLGSTIVTFHLVVLAWIFFRAARMEDAFAIIHACAFQTDLTKGLWHLGIGGFELAIAVAAIVALEIIQYLARHRTSPRWTSGWPIWWRWPVYYTYAELLLIFGRFDTRTFIYFHF